MQKRIHAPILACLLSWTLVSEAAEVFPWHADADLLCKELRQIVKSAEGNFADSKGRQSTPRTWLSRHSFTAANSCRIFARESGIHYLTCTMVTLQSPAVLRNALMALEGDVRTCLGSGWQRRLRKGVLSGNLLVVELEHPDITPTVRIEENDSVNGFDLDLKVYATDVR